MEESIDFNLLDLGQPKTTFPYSIKNIPLYKQKRYIKALLDKTQKFVKNIQWMTFFLLET